MLLPAPRAMIPGQEPPGVGQQPPHPHSWAPAGGHLGALWPRGVGCAGAQPLCVPKPSTEKAARCFLSSSRIFSSSESGSRGLLYSSSSVSEAARSPPEPPDRCEDEEGSRALFFLHLVRRFWNQTCCPRGLARLAATTPCTPCHMRTHTHLHLGLSHAK